MLPEDIELCSNPTYIQLGNVFDFENIGFSKPLSESHQFANVRFLCCADCDVGPLGFQVKDKIFVLTERLGQF